MPNGKVILVGAGPGDPELLTLKAVRALERADVVLFDSLVSAEVLEYIRATAQKFCVGKRGGRPSCKQDDIHDMMLRFARQGKTVVRLKSGDPMIFGRAGEEISILEKAGIETEIIQSVKFITAHSRQGVLPDLDWNSCTDPKTTLIVYMGAKTASQLAEAMLGHGADRDLPVLIAKGVSRPEEEISYHRLEDLLALEIDRNLPVLIGIGRVFEARLAAFETYRFQDTLLGEACALTA